jgi:choline monooxygenase
MKKTDSRDSVLLDIDSDITRASTLPAELIRNPLHYPHILEQVFTRTWHVLGPKPATNNVQQLEPVTLLPGSLNEPLLLSCHQRDLHVLSNVCTHRGNLLIDEPCKAPTIKCRYHGRSFELDGTFKRMPAFEQAQDFPTSSDSLPKVPSASLGPLLFASVTPQMTFDALLGPLKARLDFVPWSAAVLSEAKDYVINANWLLYCDNYLEGLHLPFVHDGLMEALDFTSYATELYEWASLQLGIAKRPQDAISLPAGHPDAHRNVAAFYAFLFPATMLNVYPWGVSVNAIRPLGPAKTCVTYLTFVYDQDRLGSGAGADLERVELEDEAIVERVQRGIASRFYKGGRFSPTMEQAVHHFHRLVAAQLR